MKILFADTTHPALPESLEKAGFKVELIQMPDKASYAAIIDQFDGIIIRSKFVIDDSFLAKAKKLKFIGRVGAGMENIDTAAAQKRGIACYNSPEGNRNAVAEHALGMLLALQNNLFRAHHEVRQGLWRREANRGTEIKNKTIGIIGFGNTGSTFAQKLSSMDMRILAFDKYKSNYAPSYVEETSLTNIYELCDILSLHVPLTDETYNMVNKNFLKNFKKPLIIINTARGKILKTNDLVVAMKENQVTGACLDVLEYESLSFENLYKNKIPKSFEYLCQSESVILSPHIAGWTAESNLKLSSVLAQKIIDNYT